MFADFGSYHVDAALSLAEDHEVSHSKWSCDSHKVFQHILFPNLAREGAHTETRVYWRSFEWLHVGTGSCGSVWHQNPFKKKMWLFKGGSSVRLLWRQITEQSSRGLSSSEPNQPIPSTSQRRIESRTEKKRKKQCCFFGFADEPLETLRWMASWLAARPEWVDPRFSQPDPGETRRSAARTHKSPRPHGWLWRGISSGSYSEKQVHKSHHYHHHQQQSLVTKGNKSMRHWSVASNAATLSAHFLSN